MDETKVTDVPAGDDSGTRDARSVRRGPRLWPAIVLLALYWTVRLGVVLFDPSPALFMIAYMLAPLALTVGILGWWLFASRVPWIDRLLGTALFFAAGGVAIAVAGADFPPMAMILYALHAVVTVWIGWLVFSFPLPWSVRRLGVYAAIVVCWCAVMTLRVEGMDGEFVAKFEWRWTPTAEERMLAEIRTASDRKTDASSDALPDEPLVASDGDWVEFRGPNRDSRVEGVRIATDWNANPPKELWRRRVGPGWSSFCVVGDRFFTQEQRGGEEVVVGYDLQTGDEVWVHSDATRFEELVGGPGPRATPTFAGGNLYVQGANGIVNCLDAATGRKIWSRNLVEDLQATVPIWGFSASPLVKKGVVTVFGGAEGKAVAAYDAVGGDLLWTAGDGLMSYASTQLSTIHGVEQILMSTDVGLFALDPESGKELWRHEWNSGGAARVVQPAVVDGNDVLIGTGMGIGTRRIHVEKKGDDWTTEELWTTKQFKPYYNDFVIHDGAAYGFDGPIFACVDLGEGEVLWKERGYGSGQVLLLDDQGVLIVQAETGEVALVEANQEELRELGRIDALSAKTWNHPVVARDLLLVRNGEEMACYKLPVESSGEASDTTPVATEATSEQAQE